MMIKVAMIREPGYPIGKPAPCYLNCPCGARPSTRHHGEHVACACGRVYTSLGYLVSASDAQGDQP